MATYDIGDRVRVSFAVYNATQTPPVLADPTALQIRIKPPTADEITRTYPDDVTVVRSSAGIFYTDVDVTEAGRWYIRAKATGAVVSAQEACFDVRASHFSAP